MSTKPDQAPITHITVLVDASYSIFQADLQDPVVRVLDGLMEKWKRQSLALDDMTRLTVYQFSSDTYMPNGDYIECLYYDTDISRVKSIKGRYRPDKGGGTALLDATIKAQEDLALTPTIYGDHAFLFFVITDGENNRNDHRATELRKLLDTLPENWTFAALVPHVMAKSTAARYGFPQGNILVWDATSAEGVEEAGERIAEATTSYLTSRTSKVGFRGTKSLFVGGNVDAKAIKDAKLKPMPTDEYMIVPVTAVDGLVKEKPAHRPTKKVPEPPMVKYMEIEPFISKAHPPFRVGKTLYQLDKPERIAGNKQLAVLETKTNKVYVGPGARKLLDLPDETKTVRPDANPLYKIYVQSTSLNRHLLLGTSVLILTQ